MEPLQVLQDAIDKFQPGAQRDRFIKMRDDIEAGRKTVKDIVPLICAEVNHSVLSFADTLSEAVI